MTRKAVCLHVHVSDNRDRCVTQKIVGCMSVPSIGRRCGTITDVCVHVHVSDNRESLCDDEASSFHVDTVLHSDGSDDRETLWDDDSGLRACSHER